MPVSFASSRIRPLLVVFLLFQRQSLTAFRTTTLQPASRSLVVRPLSLAPTPTNNDHELHIGKALDTLRSDYQSLLTTNPDFSLYDPNIEIVDPSGVKLHGLRNYKAAFNFIHALIRVVYCPSRSQLSYRMCFDTARQNIRISWNARIVPRIGPNAHHIDGISVYEMDFKSGQITQHRIERLLLNDRHVAPKEGVFARLRAEHGVVVPSYYGTTPTSSRRRGSSSTALYALEASDREPDYNAADGTAPVEDGVLVDTEALESRNKSRKKFGLKPLTPKEFLKLQQEIQVLGDETRRKIARAAEERQKKSRESNNKSQPGLFEKALGALNDTCETNFDCERPKVCCDFVVQKRCCSSGAFVGREMPRLVPVPASPPPGYTDPRRPPPRY